MLPALIFHRVIPMSLALVFAIVSGLSASGLTVVLLAAGRGAATLAPSAIATVAAIATAAVIARCAGKQSTPSAEPPAYRPPEAESEPEASLPDERVEPPDCLEKPDRAGFDGVAMALVKLRFADAVLSRVPTETEAATFALMERLVAIRDEAAKASVAAAASKGDSVTSDTVSALASQARATISKVREVMAEMRKHEHAAATGLQSLGKELKAAIDLLAEIGEITERSRLIAFNMAIEAARIGSRGNGFKVIVNELRTLNDRTADFSKRVSGFLGHFKEFNDSLAEKTVTDSARVAEKVEVSIADEEKAIESLMRVSHACVDLTGDVEQVVASTNKDLDGILESLQFQDITRQMVEGAQSIVSEAREEIDRLLLSSSDGETMMPATSGIESLRSRLLAASHTRSEKEAIQEAII